jgi:DNA-binding CsgD family transcriptional regulator
MGNQKLISKSGLKKVVYRSKNKNSLKTLKTTLWRVPEHNPQFVCIEPDTFVNNSRKKLLETIHDQLDQKCSDTALRCLALTGLGGIGKTQLAIEYAHQYADKYSLIAWIHANNDISQEFSELLSVLWDKKHLSFHSSRMVDYFYQKLAAFPSCLLIFDDAEDYSGVVQYLPKSQANVNHHILITSRSQHWESVIPVNVFTPQESVYFISHQLPNEPQQQRMKLAEQLGHLPLALSQAVAYIKSTAVDIHNYLLAYAETPKDILNTTLLLDLFKTTHTTSVYKTLSLSLEKLKQKDDAIVNLLKYCAYFRPDKISRVLVKNIMGYEHKLNQAIAILRNYSLVEVSDDIAVFNIHCITQAIMQFILKEEKIDVEVMLAWLKILHERYEYDREKISIFKEYLSFSDHIISLLKYAEEYVAENKDIAEFYIKVLASFAMYQVFEKHEYDCAQNKLFKSLELCHLHKVQLNLDMFAKIYNAIGFSFFRKAGVDLNKGISFFRKTLKLYKQRNNTHSAFALHGIGRILFQGKAYDEAIGYLKKALSIMQKIYSNNHIDLVLCLSSLGECYYAIAQFEQAKSACLRAIEIGQSILDGHNFDVADSFYTLSMVLQAENRNKPTQDSIEYFQKSLTIFRKLLDSPDHQDIIKIEAQMAKANSLLKGNANKPDFTITAFGNMEIKLSPREIQSLFFLVKGMSAKQTAYTLHLSQRTVETYLNQVKKKLKCRTKLQLLGKLSSEDIMRLEQYLLTLQK